nr:TfoX/Sxy family protein [uncultured Gellertiella sp.]
MENDDIHDLFRGLGEVTIRKMFGGKGIYHQGRILAVVVDGALLLKADAETAPAFVEAGCSQWGYESRSGKKAHMPYWTVPDAALDDPDDMAVWARRAYEAALRAR